METTPFGTTADGQTVRHFFLKNRNGLEIGLSEYGAIVTSIRTPDRHGKLEDVTLSKPDFRSWLDNPHYLGATIGRYGNRIAKGRFSLDGIDYQLATNNEPNGIPCHLHGGVKGFDQVRWKGQPVIRPDAEGISFTYHSDRDEEGYPGELVAEVTYWLTRDDQVVFEATATTDAPTPINLINHLYWNLSGNPGSSILDHELQIEAQAYLATTPGLIPTGEIVPVRDTPMDFTRSTRIGERLQDDFEPLKHGHGYDHCWTLRPSEEGSLHPAATLRDPKSGRLLSISTNQPGLQFYTGNFLPDPHCGLCLETQAFPDSPNQPEFPDTILRPGQTYRHRTHFKFSTFS